MRISDWSSDVCSSDLIYAVFTFDNTAGKYWTQMTVPERQASALNYGKVVFDGARATLGAGLTLDPRTAFTVTAPAALAGEYEYGTASFGPAITPANFSGTVVLGTDGRSEEHTSELQSLMRTSYAVFRWQKKKNT